MRSGGYCVAGHAEELTLVGTRRRRRRLCHAQWFFSRNFHAKYLSSDVIAFFAHREALSERRKTKKLILELQQPLLRSFDLTESRCQSLIQFVHLFTLMFESVITSIRQGHINRERIACDGAVHMQLLFDDGACNSLQTPRKEEERSQKRR